jgi:dienelactone hydrolase
MFTRKKFSALFPMFGPKPMPYLTAHFLDRVNEWFVRTRLSGRMSSHCGTSMVEHMKGLGEAIHPSPQTLGGFEPEQVSKLLWKASSPWPGVDGNNKIWYAERFVPRSRASSSAFDQTLGVAGNEKSPALILLHGWLINRPQLPIYRSWARHAARRGIEVWMPFLPFHMQRAEPGEISGQRALSPNLVDNLDMVRQGVAEARLLARWLRGRTTRVGIWGMSLGGLVAALTTTLDDDWDAVALWAPVAEPDEVLFKSGLVKFLREAVIQSGVSKDDFAAPEIAPMMPNRSDTKIDPSKMLVVAGDYDQVVSPSSVERLSRRWGIDVHWVRHGHISLMLSRAPVRYTANFLEHTLFA